MHEEQGFLDQLRQHPEDDVTRLVYADWLEDHDDSRAAYLRAEVALARRIDGEDGYDEAEGEVARLGAGLDAKWLEWVGKRWDVVLLGYAATNKIPAIRSLRESVPYRLADSLVLVELAPCVVWIAAIRSSAEEVRGRLRSLEPQARILAEIVPNDDPTKELRYVSDVRGLTCQPYRWQPSA